MDKIDRMLQLPNIFKVSCIVLSLILFGSLYAQDAYHNALESDLLHNYGLSGGIWVLSDSEEATNEKIQPTNVDVDRPAVHSDLSFSQILQLDVPQQGANSWDNAVRFPVDVPIQQGDALLLVIWTNSISSFDEKSNPVTFKYELTMSPWTQALNFPAQIDTGWRQWLIPFQAQIDYSAGQSRFQIDMGLMQGTLQIGGLAVLNYQDKYTVDQLPRTSHLNYEGREEGAEWREQALQRIEQIRKGDLHLKVVDQQGNPVPEANIEVRMKQHDFGFGTAIATRWWYRDDADAKTYLEKLADLTGDGRTFNIAVFENALKWPAWENVWHTTPEQNVEVVQWLKKQGMKVRGHNLVWPKWIHLPDDLENNKDNLNYLETRIEDHIREVAGYEGIHGQIDEWDVINEMTHCLDLENVFGTRRIYEDWINQTKQTDSNAVLYINEYSVISGGGKDVATQESYKSVIRQILDSGAPLEGIGIQGHMGTSLTPPEKILEILDDFGQFRLDISITEYDAKDLRGEIQADYMRDMLITCFSHPNVQNFLMWGFWDGSHWFEDAPIFTRDWSLKPSGQAFIDWVFEEWWSDANGVADNEGSYQPRLFYGGYEVVVEKNGWKDTTQIHFNKDADTILITVDNELTAQKNIDQIPSYPRLARNFPNPTKANTTVSFSLPKGMVARFDVLDSNGQFVQKVDERFFPAGWHSLEINCLSMPSGVYLVRMHTEKSTEVNRLVIVN